VEGVEKGGKELWTAKPGSHGWNFFLLPSIGYEPAEVHGLNKKKWQE
jgi:hypothetical protein